MENKRSSHFTEPAYKTTGDNSARRTIQQTVSWLNTRSVPIHDCCCSQTNKPVKTFDQAGAPRFLKQSILTPCGLHSAGYPQAGMMHELQKTLTQTLRSPISLVTGTGADVSYGVDAMKRRIDLHSKPYRKSPGWKNGSKPRSVQEPPHVKSLGVKSKISPW